VGADVGQKVKLVVVVAGKHQWLVQAALQQDKRLNRAGGFEVVGVAHPLPALGKNLLLYRFIHLGILIKTGWKG